MQRNLDGVYFRVQTGEKKFENLCFSDLTEEQMNEVLTNRSEEWLKSLCITLGNRIKQIGDELDLICE